MNASFHLFTSSLIPNHVPWFSVYAFPTSLFKLIPKYFILFDAVVNGTVFLILLRLFIASVQKGFPGGSDGEECACNEGDPGLIPGSGRSPGEGNGSPLQYSCQRSLARYSPWDCKELDMAEQLAHSV